MLRNLLFFLTVGLVALLAKDSLSFRFAGGFKGGTYDKMAHALDQTGILELRIQKSRGSIDNIKSVRTGKADFAFTQLDILLNLFKLDPNLKSQIAIVLPLYAEEVHLLTNKKIQSFSQLVGSKIAVGERGSGSFGTSQIFLAANKISPSDVKLVHASPEASLQSLLENRVDAMFLVSGAPVDLLNFSKVSGKEEVALMSLAGKPFETLTEGYYHYRPAAIGHNLYPWESEDKITVSVANVLICHRKISNPVIRKVIEGIFSQKAALAKVHNKWNDIDLKKMVYYMAGQTKAFHPEALKVLAERLRD